MSYITSPSPYASYSSSTTQNVVSATTGQAVTFNTIESQNGISLETSGGIGSKMHLNQVGNYLLTFSALCHKTVSSNSNMYIWLRYNGTDVVRSNTNVDVAGGNPNNMVVSFILPCATVGDYYELFLVGDTTTCQLLATPAVVAPSTPVMPAVPSIIVTINRVS